MNEIQRGLAFEYIRRYRLRAFVKEAWPIVEPSQQYKSSWHIDLICERLQAVTEGQIRNLLINIPPSFSKSILVQVFWPAWEWTLDPGKNGSRPYGPGTCKISASYDIKLTTRDARKTLLILESEWYKALWPGKFVMKADQPVTDFQNMSGGFRYSTSVRGPVTGRHCHDFVVDDPVKPLTISKTTLQQVNDWWHETVPTRFRDASRAAKVIIMQRLHEDDLSGEVLRGGDFEHLRLPMRFEKTAFSIGDPRTQDGELLCPDRMPESAVKELETNLGSRGTAAQLQQRPSPAEGAIFKRQWFQTWKTLPTSGMTLVQSWDCAFKDTDGSDYVVGQVWGMTGGKFYKIDQARGHWGFEETCAQILAMRGRYPQAMTILVEDKANGTAVIEVLQKKVPGIVPVNPLGGKESRANAITPLYESGSVLHPDPELHAWEGPAQEEMLSFPFGKNDDVVDATTQALAYLYSKQTDYAAFVKNAKEMIF
jgi:predicted phage terminase large subunit-like protein